MGIIALVGFVAVIMRSSRKGCHSVYDLRVHLVWVTKYRYKILVGKIAMRIRELIRQTCEANDIRVIRGHVSKDHVHLYVSVPPTVSVSEMMKLIKGRSSRKIQQEFPELCKKYWGKHFWAIGYAAFSAGEVTDKVIREYVSNHSEDEGTFTVAH